MTMTLDELIEHADNVAALLETKRRQLSRMALSTAARARHESAITALAGRVDELREQAAALRPALDLQRLGPCVPPPPGVVVQPETFSDLTAFPREIGAQFR